MSIKDSYFTITEAAKKLGVTRQTVSRWIASGEIDVEKIGRETIVSKTKLIQKRQHMWAELMRKIIRNRILEVYSSDLLKRGVKVEIEENPFELRIDFTEPFRFNILQEDGTYKHEQVDIGRIHIMKGDKPKVSTFLKTGRSMMEEFIEEGVVP